MILKLFHLMVSSWELPLELKLAHDGFEALPLVASWRPHLLVTDLYMPGMDGFRMIRSLRDNPDHAALEMIVVSGLTEIGAGTQEIRRLLIGRELYAATA